MKTIDSLYKKSAACKEFEPVPMDFLIKKSCMELFLELAGRHVKGMGLEIGCGSGFNSALLGSVCKRLVATDLPYYDGRTHSLGITVARNLLAKIGAQNVSLASCSGEVLPFGDNTFDFVFSSSVLEHIDNKEAALREMIRVVKPGGAVIFIIPTFMQSICAFVHLYLYIGKRLLDVLRVKVFRLQPCKKEALLPAQDDCARSSSAIADGFFKNHPSFPMPEPHGSYKNIFHEFRSQLPWSWTSFARRCGASSLDTCALLFIPFNILEVFSTRLVARSYHYTRRIHRVLARSPLQYFCYAWCVIARKN